MRRAAAADERTLPNEASLSRLLAFWENGHREPDQMYQALLCEVYGATPVELGFAQPSDQSFQADPDDFAFELLTRLETSARVDAGLVTLLRDQTHNIRLQDRRLGAAAVADQMRAHIRQVDNLLQHTIVPNQRGHLAGVLAAASTLAGWQAIDTGELQEAWAHYERGKTAAREADDPAVLAHATAEQAYVLMDLGRAEAALVVIEHAHQRDQAKLPPLLRSWLYAAEAEAHAANNDERNALRAMDASASMLPGDAENNPEVPYVSLNLAHLARWRGNCLARLGDETAISDLTDALQGMDGTFTRAEAALRCDLAMALLAKGESADARREAARARRLVAVVGSTRQRRRLENLTRRF
ncbi:XRE family transcriptional regulator [Embleya sp. NPDC055664]